MADPLLRDKIVNLSNELNNFRLQLWQQGLLIEDAQVPAPANDADDVQKMTYLKLTSGLVDALSQSAMLERRIAVREPKLTVLEAELKAVEEAARQKAES